MKSVGVSERAGAGLPSQTTSEDNASRRVERLFTLFLGVCAAGYLYRSTVKILWLDEIFSYYTDRVATVRDLFKVQMVSPVALDPPLSHIVQHFALILGHGSLLVYRLPSFFFCGIMLWSVYLFFRRLGGIYLAALTAGIVMLTPMVESQFNSARPYALLLCATGVSLLLWQNCIREDGRFGSVVGLFIALGAGVASHYYGFLLPVPFFIAETFRALTLRKPDRSVLAAIFGSYLFAVSWIPLVKAAKQYRAHYYDYLPFSLAEFYRGFFSPLHDMMTWQRGEPVRSRFLVAEHGLFVLFCCVVGFGLYAGYKASSGSTSARAEWIAVGVLAFLPILGVTASHILSGTYEARFTQEYSIGVAAAIAAGILLYVRGRGVRNGLLVLLCLAITLRLCFEVRSNSIRRAAMANYVAQLNRSSLASTDQAVVCADFELFLLLNAQYRDVAPFAQRMIWLYDFDRSITWTMTDTNDRTMMNMGKFSNLHVIPYEVFTRSTDHFQLFNFAPPGSGPSWMPKAIRAEGGVIVPRETIEDASGLVGNHALYEVHLPNAKR